MPDDSFEPYYIDGRPANEAARKKESLPSTGSLRRIVLLEERKGDTWYITGENIKGLWMWGKDREKLWAAVPVTVDALLSANDGGERVVFSV